MSKVAPAPSHSPNLEPSGSTSLPVSEPSKQGQAAFLTALGGPAEVPKSSEKDVQDAVARARKEAEIEWVAKLKVADSRVANAEGESAKLRNMLAAAESTGIAAERARVEAMAHAEAVSAATSERLKEASIVQSELQVNSLSLNFIILQRKFIY